MIVITEYLIKDVFLNEAEEYADLSKAHTSNRHNFYLGGLDNKRKKV